MKTLWTTTMAVLALSGMAVAAFAQGSPNISSVRALPTDNPFDPIVINRTMVDPETIAAWMTILDEAQQQEVKATCEVLVASPARYDISYRAWCQTLLDGA